MSRVLVTGGAGFIGSHLADLLLAHGYRVRVLDSLAPQVHGDEQACPSYLDAEVELAHGDVRNPVLVRRALEGADMVVHLAAAVGVGQSMYQIADYVGVNELGTAVLLEALLSHPVERLVVASSMSIYGEGLARTLDGRLTEPEERPLGQLKQSRWEPVGPDGEPLAPLPTPESKRPALGSVYALNKYTQERLCLVFGRAYDLPVTALRFFNVYGTRQALSNPYTGVLAIFASRLLNGRPPMIFEDGQQRRDFVHVRDVARACLAAVERPEAAGEVVNVGSGVSRTVEDVARALAHAVGRPDLQPQVTGRYRAGDIRHCFADIGRARELLGFQPEENFDEGLAELAEWLAGKVAIDRVDQATEELARRGLVA
ncbi:MAG TPA: NAD-dependent epimerase/dehydratase family protein [Geminicoccaceae bacterium]|nr:NAD-dependent epimerase/dehydratase family protein [Geminicoccaceae bacterium]